jgi:hypothetical protein
MRPHAAIKGHGQRDSLTAADLLTESRSFGFVASASICARIELLRSSRQQAVARQKMQANLVFV